MNRDPKFEVVSKPDMLFGINQIKTNAQTLSYDKNGRLTTSDVKQTLIPYYAWAHRGNGNMSVWLAEELRASRPAMPPTIASGSKISASHMDQSISAINDRLIPKDEEDTSIPHYNWWPKKGGTEWITYEFEKESTISHSTVYWYDDEPWGGYRIPKQWRIYYKDNAGNWQPVPNDNGYEIKKGVLNLPCEQ
ncbi:MAG: hypothetical protein LBS88_03540 [Tannerellaceae bacterium]|jgi:hypothetical protein|nr:hypothetical protein [Tannerellaceae bacterium]